MGVAVAAAEVGNVLGAGGRRSRSHLLLAGVALLKVVELDAGAAGHKVEAVERGLVKLALGSA